MSLELRKLRSRNRHENIDEPHRENEFAFRCYKGNSSTQSNPNQSTNINDTRTAGSEGSIVLGSGSSGQVTVTNTTTDMGAIAAAGDAVSKIAEASTKASADAVASASGAASDSAYSSALSSQAASAAAERAAYEAGQVALGSAKEAARAAESAAFESSKASAAAAASAQQAASDAIAGNVDVSRTAIQSTESVARDSIAAQSDAVDRAFGFGENATNAISDAAKSVIDFRSEDTKAALNLAEVSQKQAADLLRYGYENFTSKLASNAGDAPQETVQNIVKYVATAAVLVVGIGVIVYASKKA